MFYIFIKFKVEKVKGKYNRAKIVLFCYKGLLVVVKEFIFFFNVYSCFMEKKKIFLFGYIMLSFLEFFCFFIICYVNRRM